MTARSLPAAATDLAASPRPVLFLDTCDLVNLLQVVTTVPVRELRAVNRLLAALAANPLCCQPVVTWVTAEEFPQKTDPSNRVYVQDSLGQRLPPDEVAFQLAQMDAQIGRIHLVRQELGVPLSAPSAYSALGLLADLQTTAEMLLASCWVLQRDPACVDAAIRRVFERRRPSHKREVKDSLHLEHCLELARQMRGQGFAESILFASANKSDYGPAAANQPHPDLQPEFAAVQMTYHDSLGDAIAHLGL